MFTGIPFATLPVGPVYGYQLAIQDPLQQQPLVAGSDLANLSYHTTDLGYVFNNDNDAHVLVGRHVAILHLMIGLWGAFVASGDPNTRDDAPRVAWPCFMQDQPTVLSISDTPFAKRDFAEKHRCAFWKNSDLVGPTW